MFSFADFRFPSFARPLDALRRLILQEPVSFHDSAISSKPFPTCRRLPVAFDGARCSTSSTFQCFNLSTFQLFFQESHQLLCCSSAVADGVLLVGRHFCKADSASFGLEYGVVAESFATVAFVEDFSFDDAFEEMFLSLIY